MAGPLSALVDIHTSNDNFLWEEPLFILFDPPPLKEGLTITEIAIVCDFPKYDIWLFQQEAFEQVALLWQRDCVTRLSVEILQLQNIPFEN